MRIRRRAWVSARAVIHGGALWCLLGFISIRAWAGHSVGLAWDSNTETNLAGYKVYYGLKGQNQANVVDPGNRTAITITELSEATTYWFYVTAYNSQGFESNPSTLIYWTGPTILGGLALDSGVRLWWAAGNAAIGYVVKRSTAVVGPYVPISTNSAANYVDRTVTNGGRYFYSVSILTTVGESRGSVPVSVEPRQGPSSLTAQDGVNRIRLAWTGFPGATVYQLYRAEPTDGPYRLIATNLVATLYEDTAVHPGRAYHYALNAILAAGGTSGFSQDAIGTTAPSAPSSLSLSLFAANAVSLHWSAAEPVIDGFVIEQSLDGKEFTRLAEVAGTIRQTTVEGFDRGSTYFFRIHATNIAGRSANSLPAPIVFPTFGANVMFGPALAPSTMPGYTDDRGAVFGVRASGLRYGWNRDVSATAMERGSALSPDKRFDSFIRIGSDDTWEIEIPTGSYSVRLVAGDPYTSTGVYQFLIEGLETAAQSLQPGTDWIEYSKKLFVNDGRLTLAAGPLAANLKLCFVDVYAELPESPVIDLQPSSQSLIEGQAMTLIASAGTGTEPLVWQWYLNGTALPGAKTPKLEIGSVGAPHAGRYSVVVSNQAGSATSAAAIVQVSPLNEPPTLSAIPSIIVAAGGGPRRVFLTGITSGTIREIQTLEVSATDANPGILLGIETAYTSPSDIGSLRLTPIPGMLGSTVITVTVDDGADNNALVQHRFTVTLAKSLNDPLLIEAESGQIDASKDIFQDATASNGEFVQPLSTGGGTLFLPFELPFRNTYFVWCRIFGYGFGDEPFLVSVDSEPSELDDTRLVLDSPLPWHWVRIQRRSHGDPRIFELGAGIHKVAIRGQNQIALLDAVILTSNPAFIPDEFGPNSPPTMEPIGDLVIPQDAGLQTVFLTGITTGASEELQPLTITATSSNPELIPHPQIGPIRAPGVADLTFTPVPGISGTSTITVTVNDGQLLYSIINRTFLVSINPGLKIEASRFGTLVSWPTNQAAGFVLQTATELGDSVRWSNVRTAVDTINGRFVVSFPAADFNRFFRLCRDCAGF